MDVIRKLGDRVEKEHDQYLRDAQRIEDRSATTVNGAAAPTTTGAVDFESLVGGNAANTVKADSVVDTSQQGWDDDVWGSIFSSGDVSCGVLNRGSITDKHAAAGIGKSAPSRSGPFCTGLAAVPNPIAALFAEGDKYPR